MKQFDFNDQWNSKRVEPKRRMVGGKFGWAFHRFPIKGGITPAQAHQITITEAVNKIVYRSSFFAKLVGAIGSGQPIERKE